MDNNWVSVIVPTYNRSGFITTALDSVWRQTHRPIELLIVDDGSIDNTKDIVYKWIITHDKDEFFDCKYIYQKNAGAPSARNNGIRNSKGRYLQFLDSDDYLVDEKIQLQIEILKKESTGVCLCDYYSVDGNGKSLYKVRNDVTHHEIIRFYVGVSTFVPLIDKTAFDFNQLQWNVKLKKCQDIDFYVKLALVSDRFSYLDEYLCTYVLHGGDRIFTSNNSDFWAMLKSLLRFHVINLRRIKRNKYKPLIILYCRFFYKSLNIGTIPKFLKKENKIDQRILR